MARGRSLHIGINTLDPEHYGEATGALVACEADARDLAAITADRGFDAATLLGAEASRGNVIGALADALEALGEEDALVLTFAGRGGVVPAASTDTSTDGDPAWCLHDGALLEEELYTLLAGFRPGCRVVVIADCGHSDAHLHDFRTLAETPAIRPLVDPRSDPTAPMPAVRLLAPEVALRTFRQHRDYYASLRGTPARQPAADTIRAAARVFTACQDNQLALDGTHNGLYTATLLAVWQEGAFEGTWASLHRAVVARMPLTQVPMHVRLGGPSRTFDREKPFTV